jgi:hypothetical protein
VVAKDPYRDMVNSLATAAGQVANYCDSVEHNETAERAWVLDAAEILRSAAFSLADLIEEDVVELYARRLALIEQRGVAGALPEAFDGSAAAREATTWLDLQLVQLRHDRHFHPDVAGLSKYDQLRHYAFHLAKLVAAFTAAQVDEGSRADAVARRLADTLLFGLALETVMGERLEARPFRDRSA